MEHGGDVVSVAGAGGGAAGLMTEMNTTARLLNVQLQPALCESLVIESAKAAFESALLGNILTEQFLVSEGNDEGAFVNFTIQCTEPEEIWEIVSELLNRGDQLSEQISSCSIVICQGDHGWDDYLLLHHFNASLQLDEFSEIE